MPNHIRNIAGQTFGRLTVSEESKTVSKKRVWLCKCECGTEKWVASQDIVRGKIKSCGCLMTEMRGTLNRSHGHTSGKASPTYSSWMAMLSRVRNPNAFGAPTYHGMHIDPRWLKFENFLADMGERPEGKTLDRKKGNRGYEPDNCRWASPLEQAQNRSNNVSVIFEGIVMGQAEAARQLAVKSGIKFFTALSRIKRIHATAEESIPVIQFA